jgi:hypothetical protein
MVEVELLEAVVLEQGLGHRLGAFGLERVPRKGQGPEAGVSRHSPHERGDALGAHGVESHVQDLQIGERVQGPSHLRRAPVIHLVVVKAQDLQMSASLQSGQEGSDTHGREAIEAELQNPQAPMSQQSPCKCHGALVSDPTIAQK